MIYLLCAYSAIGVLLINSILKYSKVPPHIIVVICSILIWPAVIVYGLVFGVRKLYKEFTKHFTKNPSKVLDFSGFFYHVKREEYHFGFYESDNLYRKRIKKFINEQKENDVN